jgi:hypothetical protein
VRSTRGEKIRRKFHRYIEFFCVKGGTCSYDDDTKDDIKVPSRYTHIVKMWEPKQLPQLDTNFCVNERIYHIAPSSIHGVGLFSMDGIKVKYGGVTKLMEYVKPCYNYGDWMRLARYMQSMQYMQFLQIIYN